MALPGFNAETALTKPASITDRTQSGSRWSASCRNWCPPRSPSAGHASASSASGIKSAADAPVSPGTASIFYDSVICDNAGTPRLKVPPYYDQRSMMEGARK